MRIKPKGAYTAAMLVGLSTLLLGCQTQVEYQAKIDQGLDLRLGSYTGLPVSVFMANTGLAPSNAYDVTGGRIFVVEGNPVYLTLPATAVTPAVTRTSVCRLQIQTVATSKNGTADDWKITGTTRTGPCNNLVIPMAR